MNEKQSDQQTVFGAEALRDRNRVAKTQRGRRRIGRGIRLVMWPHKVYCQTGERTKRAAGKQKRSLTMTENIRTRQ